MDIERIICDIEKAMKAEGFMSALALTLTLPDVCAQIEYPSIYHKEEEYEGHKGQGAAYSKWYDEYIAKYEIDPESEGRVMTGRECWRLRCGLFHDVKIDMDNLMSSEKEEVRFEFIASTDSNNEYLMGGASMISTQSGQDGKMYHCIQLDIVNFCKKIIEVFRHTYLKNDEIKAKLDQNKVSFSYIDYPKRNRTNSAE